MFRRVFACLAIFISSILPTVKAQDEQKMLKDFDSELTPLKEQVFQTKSKVEELREAVLHGKIIGSKAYISFENEAEGFFSLVSLEFYLDNDLIKKIAYGKNQKPAKKFEIYNSDIPSGDHLLKAKVVYRGADKSIYKAFSYFQDQEFTTEANENFTVDYGKTTAIKVTTLDKGFFQKKIDERLYMQINVSQEWGTDSSE